MKYPKDINIFPDYVEIVFTDGDKARLFNFTAPHLGKLRGVKGKVKVTVDHRTQTMENTLTTFNIDDIEMPIGFLERLMLTLEGKLHFTQVECRSCGEKQKDNK